MLRSQTTTTVDQIEEIFGDNEDILEFNIDRPKTLNHNQTTIKVVVTPKAHFGLLSNDSFKALFYDLSEHSVIAFAPKAIYYV